MVLEDNQTKRKEISGCNYLRDVAMTTKFWPK